MKLSQYLIALTLVIFVFGLFPQFVSASSDFAALVPCGFKGSLGPLSYCTQCEFFLLIQNVLNFIWWDVTLWVAILAFLYGGFLMMFGGGLTEIVTLGTGGEKNVKQISRGKTIITNTLVGIIIVFIAWLGIDYTIKVISRGAFEARIGPWNTLICPDIFGGGGTPTGGGSGLGEEGGSGEGSGGGGGGAFDGESGGEDGGGGQPADPTRYSTHEEAAQFLASNSISVSSSGNCSDASNSTCTSLEGIKKNTLNEAVRFKNECACTVIVTGGTETGHSIIGTKTHANGDKVDIARTAEVDSWIESKYIFSGTRSGDNAKIYKAPNGTEYAKEHDHWDVRGWEATP